MEIEARLAALEAAFAERERRMAVLAADFAALRRSIDWTAGEGFADAMALEVLFARDGATVAVLPALQQKMERFISGALHSTSSESFLRGFETRRDQLLAAAGK